MLACSSKILSDPQRKRDYNRTLFQKIASNYNRANVFLSFKNDLLWKNFLVSALPQCEPRVIIDLACGTGDITTGLRNRFPKSLIVGLDITEEMLDEAKKRIRGQKVFLSLQDMSLTALCSSSVDLLTGGYALRNSPDLKKTISEIRRILKPGGTAAFLDFSRSSSFLLSRISLILLLLWGALWGTLFYRDPNIYMYLSRSLKAFPTRPQLHRLFQSQGFEFIQSRLYLCGLIEVFVVKKEI